MRIRVTLVPFLSSLAAYGAAPNYDVAAAEARQLIAELVAADTTNPPGNEARAAAIGAARLKAAGIPYEIYEFAPGRANLIARLKGVGQDKPLLLLSHTDVVGASGQPWASDPHKLIEKDGYLAGRGCFDDLGMSALAFEVVKLLKQSNTPLRRDVILAWTGDEESGGEGIRWQLKNKFETLDAGVAINEGGTLVLGENGKPKVFQLQVAEKSNEDFEVIATGPTGHSSVPLPGNSIIRLAHALDKLGQHRFPARLVPATRAFFEARAKVESGRTAEAMRAVVAAYDAKKELPADAVAVIEQDVPVGLNLRTTCVATTINGGTRVNALPASAKANVNCRMLPDETADGVRQQLISWMEDPGLEVKAAGIVGFARASPAESEVSVALRKVLGEMYPGVPVVPFMGRGFTDSRSLRAGNIESYGANPLALTELEARRAHGVDERIPVGSLRPAVELYHRLVLELAGRSMRVVKE
jgi:acetylornithine deacetylase/succinyl-diaminopimelate desuccinylase-like protein